MYKSIHGVWVTADPQLKVEEISNFVAEELKSWTWEGKVLGKMDFMIDKHGITIYSYEKTSVQRILL